MSDHEKNDPIMNSINKSLQSYAQNGQQARYNDNTSEISTISSISNISSLQSSIYTIRHDRRVDLYHYFKEKLDTYRSDILYHLGISGIVGLMALLIGVDIFYTWLTIIASLTSLIYAVFTIVQLSSIIRVWRHNRSEGINRFWSLCLTLASKNALLLQEYIDVYNYRLNKTRNTNQAKQNEGQTYIIDDDASYQSIPPLEFKKIIKRIHSYIRLSYDLSTLKKSDNLVLQGGIVFCNVSDQSITDKRNRDIEKLLNSLDATKRADIVDGWNSIDKRGVNNSVMIIPYRWIAYEYRNLFRYLNSSKYLREIYDALGRDFMTYQQTVDKISSSLHNIYCKPDSYIPPDISQMAIRLSDILTIIMDAFLAVSIIHHILLSTTLIGFIFNLLISSVFGFAIHLITIITLYSIRDTLLADRSCNLDGKMDLIMKQIEIICC